MKNYQIKLLPTPDLPRDKVVYLHRRSTDNTPYYIGIGEQTRPYRVDGRNHDWTKVFNEHGRIVEILFSNLIEWTSKTIEVVLIFDYRRVYGKYRDGGIIVNLSDGGEGCSGFEMTDEQKAKISASKTGENHPNYGKELSEGTRAKISASLTGDLHPNYGKFGEQHNRFKGFSVGINDNQFVILSGNKEIEDCCFSAQNISACILGRPKYKSHKGFKWFRMTTINPDDFIGLEPYNELSAERLKKSTQ